MATINVKPGREGYKVLFDTNTVIMNYKFAAAAAKYGTTEYNLMKNIRADFPGMKEVVVSGRVQTSAKANHRLTYDHMKQYMEVYENGKDLIDVFETVKAASIVLANPYKYVSDWFKAQFPDYKTAPMLKDGHLAVVPVNAPEIKEYKQKIAKAG